MESDWVLKWRLLNRYPQFLFSWKTSQEEIWGKAGIQEAIEKEEREFEIYREREMRLLESDFDKAVKRLRNKNGESTEDTKDV